MTSLLNDEIKTQVSEVFSQMQEPVQVIFFGKDEECDYCDDTQLLLEEVTGLSDKIDLNICNLEKDNAIAKQYKMDRAPGFVIAGKDGDQLLDYGIRYAGIPSGHEFSSLINTVLLVSGRDSKLGEDVRDMLKDLDQPVNMMVFVTPTCPYCPQAVVLAHQMALESPMIEAEMIEATEFPDLSMRFNVSGVPQTTINEGAGTVVGAVPEGNLVAEILRALN
ncbi:MAG: thioredoxin family protein [Anaerolineales bacterium]|nr:thioredoxin family protein [Anaerolineales bacterium]